MKLKRKMINVTTIIVRITRENFMISSALIIPKPLKISENTESVTKYANSAPAIEAIKLAGISDNES